MLILIIFSSSRHGEKVLAKDKDNSDYVHVFVAPHKPHPLFPMNTLSALMLHLLAVNFKSEISLNLLMVHLNIICKISAGVFGTVSFCVTFAD